MHLNINMLEFKKKFNQITSVDMYHNSFLVIVLINEFL